ncbi:hypothetical protein YTPLAS73_10960 [Nitrosarchaeum sp.]|nr:hypothetical protein YTPLAS73_10960 [Nitrosarchaeum sp.]
MLIPFNVNDYNRNFFKTTVKKAKEKYDSFGISLEQVEQKIVNLLEIEYNSLKKFRETGVDDLIDDEETLSIKGRLEYAPEDIGGRY